MNLLSSNWKAIHSFHAKLLIVTTSTAMLPALIMEKLSRDDPKGETII